ncbi:MAG: HEPN domain-containing protein [Actinomycetota bacterium]|nr:HEPN domain-containing protein [Actinomycetota bacterium]
MSDRQSSAAHEHSWLDKADDGLRVARVILAGGIGAEWAACFHAQQAAEKALKALLVHLGIDFPKSHSLGRLSALMPTGVEARFDSDALATLDPWAVAGRYPEDIDDPDHVQATRTVDIAADIVEQSRAIIDDG